MLSCTNSRSISDYRIILMLIRNSEIQAIFKNDLKARQNECEIDQA